MTEPNDKPVKAPSGKKAKGADFTGPDGEPVHIRNTDDVLALEGRGDGGTIIYLSRIDVHVSQSVEEVKRILDGDVPTHSGD